MPCGNVSNLLNVENVLVLTCPEVQRVHPHQDQPPDDDQRAQLAADVGGGDDRAADVHGGERPRVLQGVTDLVRDDALRRHRRVVGNALGQAQHLRRWVVIVRQLAIDDLDLDIAETDAVQDLASYLVTEQARGVAHPRPAPISAAHEQAGPAQDGHGDDHQNEVEGIEEEHAFEYLRGRFSRCSILPSGRFGKPG